MKSIFQRFFSPTLLCDMPRIQCTAWTGFGVRLTPDSLCDMLRIMQIRCVFLESESGTSLGLFKNKGAERVLLRRFHTHA